MIYRSRYSNHNFFTAIYSAASLLFLKYLQTISWKTCRMKVDETSNLRPSFLHYRPGQRYQAYFFQVPINVRMKNASCSRLLYYQELFLELTVLLTILPVFYRFDSREVIKQFT